MNSYDGMAGTINTECVIIEHCSLDGFLKGIKQIHEGQVLAVDIL